MASSKKIAAVAAVLAVIAGGYYFVNSGINSVVKTAIEKLGSEVTQTNVNVGSVRISLTSGEGSINGFTVGNPQSFVAAKAVDIGATTVKIDTASIAGTGPVIINEITIDKPEIVYEVNAKGSNNLSAIEKNIQKATGEKPADKTAEANAAPARKVIIKNLYINDGKVGITHALLKGKELSSSLPAIHLTNIGGDSKGAGATPEQVAKKILGEISRSAGKVSVAALEKDLGGAIKNATDAAKSEMENATRKLFSN